MYDTCSVHVDVLQLVTWIYLRANETGCHAIYQSN